MLCYAKSLQSYPTLCHPIDGSSQGSPVPGILQARTLEWVAISLSNAWKWKVKVKSLSCVRLLVTPWTAAYQGPPSMGFSRQEYWSGVPLPSPADHKSANHKTRTNTRILTLYQALVLNILEQYVSKCGPWSSNMSTTWESTDSLALPQIYWSKTLRVTQAIHFNSLPGNSDVC